MFDLDAWFIVLILIGITYCFAFSVVVLYLWVLCELFVLFFCCCWVVGWIVDVAWCSLLCFVRVTFGGLDFGFLLGYLLLVLLGIDLSFV